MFYILVLLMLKIVIGGRNRNSTIEMIFKTLSFPTAPKIVFKSSNMLSLYTRNSVSQWGYTFFFFGDLSGHS